MIGSRHENRKRFPPASLKIPPLKHHCNKVAERRGVAVRIVLDPREPHDFVKLGDLSDNVRIKRGGPFMHLKAYSIDEEELRTGSANFSTSGENAQDNDLIVIRDPGAAAKFDVHFERMWNAAQPTDEFEPAIKALEPK